jgi:hypothetical protein
MKIIVSWDTGVGSIGSEINAPTNPFSISSSCSLAKYSTAVISKTPGVLIESVASILQHVLLSGASASVR